MQPEENTQNDTNQAKPDLQPQAGRQADSPAPQPAQKDEQKKVKVLCIEDEHFINELYNRALTKAGFDVKMVIDGETGLKEAKTDQYDIILLDIMVPNMIGTEILKRLRDTRITPRLHSKIIVTTNLELGDDDRAAIESQADGYIVKADMTPKQLGEFIKQIKI